MLHRLTTLALLFAASAARADTIADFDARTIAPAAPVLTIVAGDDAKNQHLHYEAEGKSNKLINLPLPQGLALDGLGTLSAKFRAGATPDELRWFGVDENRKVIFQRKFTVPAGEKFERIDFPLTEWRWGGEFTGEWREVRTLILRVENENPNFDLDDVELARAEAKEDVSVVALAFGDKARVLAKEQLLVATDALEEIPEPEQQAMLDRMVKAHAWLKRVAGDAYRPTHQPQPACLLIFREPDADDAFFKRLGERWRVDIAPPTQGGYTVQSIATSVWDAAKGPNRPVYLHEAVHAIAARELRLIPGTPGHGPLQEGLANYVQLVVYPQSLEMDVFGKAFAKPMRPGSLFIPLATLVKGPGKSRQYAQLASLVGYMAEKEPANLVTWIRVTADGTGLEEALKAKDDSIEKLQERWWAWGVERYVDKQVEQHFSTPEEFR